MTTNTVASAEASIAQKLFKKLSVLFMAALNRSTDTKVLKDLDFVAQKELITKGVFNINELFGKPGKQAGFIHFAVEDNRIPIIQWLLDNKADVNLANELGDTPLHVAITAASLTDSKSKDMIEFLLSHGANRTIPNKSGQTADAKAKSMGLNLDNVRSSGVAEVAPVLTAEEEAEARQKELQNQLKQLKMLQKQLSMQFEELVNVKDDALKRAELSRAIFTTIVDPKNAPLLIEKQLVNRPIFPNDRAMLHFAASAGDPVITQALLRAKADPNKQDSVGETALHIACRDGVRLIVEILLADTRTDTSLKHYVTQQTAFDVAVNGEEFRSIVRDKNLRLGVAKTIAELTTQNRVAIAELEKEEEMKKEKEKEDAVAKQVTEYGLSQWKVQCKGPYKDMTYGTDFHPLESVEPPMNNYGKGSAASIVSVYGAYGGLGGLGAMALRQDKKKSRRLSNVASPNHNFASTLSSPRGKGGFFGKTHTENSLPNPKSLLRVGTSAGVRGSSAVSPRASGMGASGRPGSSLGPPSGRPGSSLGSTGPRMSIRERLEARKIGGGPVSPMDIPKEGDEQGLTLTLSRHSSTRMRRSSGSVGEVDGMTEEEVYSLPNAEVAARQLAAVTKCAQYIYDRLIGDDVFDLQQDMLSDYGDAYSRTTAAFDSASSNMHILSKFSSYRDVLEEKHQTASQHDIHKIFRIYRQLFPSSPVLPEDILDSIARTLGQPTRANITAFLHCIAVACSRYRDLSWDFALFDCHDHTQNGISRLQNQVHAHSGIGSGMGLGMGLSVGMGVSHAKHVALPEFANVPVSHGIDEDSRLASELGSLSLGMGSPCSLGAIPAEYVELLSTSNSVDRAASYKERQEALERVQAKKALMEKKKLQKNPKDTTVVPDMYGRFSHEDKLSALWKEVAEHALDSADIVNELEQLGFVKNRERVKMK